MHDNHRYDDLLRGAAYPLDGIVEQGRAEPCPWLRSSTARRARIATGIGKRREKALARGPGRLGALKLTGHERVVATHRPALIGCDEGADRIASLPLARVPMQPAVEQLLAAGGSAHLVA